MNKKLILLLFIFLMVLSTIACAEYVANYTAEDIPAVVTDAVIEFPVAFYVTGMFRLAQFVVMTGGIIMILIGGIKLLIKKIQGN